LFLRCDIEHFLQKPQGHVEYQAAAGGYQQKVTLECDINVQIHILRRCPKYYSSWYTTNKEARR